MLLEENLSIIPNKLWQTWSTYDLPISLKNQSYSWYTSNPQLEKSLFNDNDCSKFIKEHFGEYIHKLYLALPQPIMRADFWRIAVVYIYGGYYSDLDITCNESLQDLVKGTPKAVFVKELDNISNFFFGAIPNHPVIKLTLDYMIEESKAIVNKDVQSFGMHNLHRAVRKYYKIQETNYISDNNVAFLNNEELKTQEKFIHYGASLHNDDSGYLSWRKSAHFMNKERMESENILFFTTFNKNGYDLYGNRWIETFIPLANYYNKFKAKIYYEGFTPKIEHPSITWIKYEDAIIEHAEWKNNYITRNNHSDYVKSMTIRFSHKAFVIQHVLDNNIDDYLIWLDGDCLFKNADYTHFPKNIIADKFLACQVESNHDLNHIESGILIFNGKHTDKTKFNQEFKNWYKVDNILPMGQPYDGFLIFKSLLTSGLDYIDLNKDYGKGGIQSDPNMTFCHPEIKNKFLHNIGWTGKNQYDNWHFIYQRDDIYQKMKVVLFGNSEGDMLDKKQQAFNKLEKLKSLRQ